ncbi:hypothetical protein AVEN_7878-1 [Araneus ventricosus]|uniref:Uncharacterized protein n=1 Tax=Araneus ventricosus TaxID=182803 RepID=A0A4Y2WX94_ARAVE|nr:hypothetical protein AVEN_7878-1 [Araneus ventricosus]
MYEKTPCDVKACQEEYIRAGLGSGSRYVFYWHQQAFKFTVDDAKPSPWTKRIHDRGRCESITVDDAIPSSRATMHEQSYSN